MDDSLGEAAAAAAALSQVPAWSPYSLSLPSEPPDIRNWFSSYEYESPEVLELHADYGAHNGSETEDPFEHLNFPREDGAAVRKDRLGGQSENDVFDRKDLVPADENEITVKKPAKRKQSLRALFGFIEKQEGDAESEFQVELPLQRDAPEPLRICNATGPLDSDAKRSQEGVISHSKVPMDCNCISSVDTQRSSQADQEVEYSKFPVTCVGSGLADNKKCCPRSGIFSIEHDKMLVDSEGISSAETQVSCPADQEHVYCKKLTANYVSSSLADIKKCLPEDSFDNMENTNVSLDSDGSSSVDTQASSPADQEVEYSKQAGFTDVHQKDGIDSLETPNSLFAKNVANSEKAFQDGPEHNILTVCPHSIILADNKEDSPVKKVDLSKPASESKGPEQTVASNGFIAIKRKHRLPEECSTRKVPKYTIGRYKAALQENQNVPARQKNILAQVNARSPLADRTNFTEAAAAPAAGLRGKWKCPSKGKPRVDPPMRQLRLDQWLR